MRIGLYGMPCAGKSTVLKHIAFMEKVAGSSLLHKISPDFENLDNNAKVEIRMKLADMMKEKPSFIMDGHYSFGEDIAFTESDGELYDAIVYLFVSPDVLRDRMAVSEKNSKYIKYDLNQWQQKEIHSLRRYCHEHNKDFYVIDNPPSFLNEELTLVLRFIKDVYEGFSCYQYARQCAEKIIYECKNQTITLFDGDKTVIVEDSSSSILGYKTHLYDGNFYTGYQSWKQYQEFDCYSVPEISNASVHLNQKVHREITKDSFILSSGHEKIWEKLASFIGVKHFCSRAMAADTKYFITKILQDEGKNVIAYGDGMNDYFMIKMANKGYLVTKQDGSISKSFKGRDLEGLIYV